MSFSRTNKYIRISPTNLTTEDIELLNANEFNNLKNKDGKDMGWFKQTPPHYTGPLKYKKGSKKYKNNESFKVLNELMIFFNGTNKITNEDVNTTCKIC